MGNYVNGEGYTWTDAQLVHEGAIPAKPTGQDSAEWDIVRRRLACIDRAKKQLEGQGTHRNLVTVKAGELAHDDPEWPERDPYRESIDLYRKRILKLRKDGFTIPQIAQKIGFKQGTVRSALRRWKKMK